MCINYRIVKLRFIIPFFNLNFTQNKIHFWGLKNQIILFTSHINRVKLLSCFNKRFWKKSIKNYIHYLNIYRLQLPKQFRFKLCTTIKSSIRVLHTVIDRWLTLIFQRDKVMRCCCVASSFIYYLQSVKSFKTVFPSEKFKMLFTANIISIILFF